jgi:hypothetical protein
MLTATALWSVEAVSEYELKAAYLLNFARFVQWPSGAFAGPASPINICILGEDPFGQTLDHLVAGESIEGRKVSVERTRKVPTEKTCQILFIGKSESEGSQVAEVGPGVLTVSDRSGFLKQGGMIEFVLDGHRVRFDINQRAASAASINISARLLTVARVVKK